jgi:hypothetical protein
MKIPISIELIENDGLPQSVRPLLQVTALGATRKESLARLREAIILRMMEGPVLRAVGSDTSDDERRE